MPKTKPSTINLTYHDPGRTFDGTPYEAAGKAVVQTSNVLKLGQKALRDTAILVRNAWMQRNLDLGGSPSAEDWEESPESRLLRTLSAAFEQIQRKLGALHRSASYDPNNPPK